MFLAWTQESQTQLPTGMNHVCMCFPHWGTVSLEWVETTYGPLRFIPQADFAKSHRLSRGILNLDVERNLLVTAALEDKTVTHIFFMDTDILAENPKDPNQSLRHLLSANAPIISSLYRAKKSKGDYPYAMWMKNPQGEGYLAIDKWTGNFIPVSVVGFGAILIKREVFEKVPRPWFEWKEQGQSEDFFACEKFAKYGYETRVLTDVRFSHVATTKVICSDGSVHLLDV